MKVILNPDKEIVKKIKEGLKKKNGYCPCRIEKTEDTKCMCKEFRDQIKDENFEGFCHCMLYYKEKWYYIDRKTSVILCLSNLL